MAFEVWGLFVVAAFGLACVPGPNALLALSHGAQYGYKKTIWTIYGGIVGFFVLITVSMLGLGAVLETKPQLMVGLQWLGASYLAWLGYKLFSAPALSLADSNNPIVLLRRDLFRQGCFAALSNPKVLLFFTAFLAQFIDPQKPFIPQFVVITLTFLCIEFFVEFCVARVADKVKFVLVTKGRLFNQCCAGIFLSLAAISIYNTLV
ncbi:LysE family translocator [Vibrio taketomensis]|uniref:LysE family translocator n=1 Tax=Vibrio taketomensis TaxID=2572923 RepID=UPI00138A59D2|nr:LysE family translocator [Vibrio taketomensis]